MAKNINTKKRILCLLEILKTDSNEEHPISIKSIIKKLEDEDIFVERKAIYDDIKTLNDFGYDIIYTKENNTGYYMASRKFELPELTLLADAVASSRFITEKKSRRLINKISTLTNKYDSQKIGRQLILANRIKAKNEKIYYNIDSIHEAIRLKRNISFKYFNFDIDKNKIYKNDGNIYTVSPISLCWDDENYYLIANYIKYGVTHFRVDKMEYITVLDEKVSSDFDNFDSVKYSNEVFSMFKGEKSFIKINFDMSLLNVVYDRFGLETSVEKIDNNTFCARITAQASPAFFGWIFQFGPKAKIVYPDNIKKQFKEYIKSVEKNYF